MSELRGRVAVLQNQDAADPDDLDAVFGGNAARFYRLDSTPRRQGRTC